MILHTMTCGKLKKMFIPIKMLFMKNGIYKKYIKDNYDVEIAFLEGPITRLFSAKNEQAKKIAWIHNDISQVFGKGIKSELKRKIDKNIYTKYNTIVFVSNDNLKRFQEVYLSNNKNHLLNQINKEVIYNYIDTENVIKKSQEPIEEEFDEEVINFVTVARLVPQKAIDRLIRVHQKLMASNLEHRFYVIGDGPEKEKLNNMIKENNVQDSFYLLGKRENPYPYIKKSDYFCLLSNFEGYGMVLEEAKILDKYIIITDTAGREAVQGYNKCMILPNDEQEICEGLSKIIQNSVDDVKSSSKEKYDNTHIIVKIEKLFN